MFLLLPVWHDDSTRFPVVTAFFILLNIVVFLIVWPLENSKSGAVDSAQLVRVGRDLVRILEDPSSRLTQEQLLFLRNESKQEPFPSDSLKEFFKQVETGKPLFGKSEYDWNLTYPLFKGYEESIRRNPRQWSPFRKYGLLPDQGLWPGLLTHQFLHAGWLHLLSNMIFLWVFSMVIEEKLSWHVAWIYILGGVGAAAAQMMWHLPKHEVMVGASGSISALMGFALGRFPSAPVRLFWISILMIFPRWGAFRSPLWFFAIFWFLEQVGMALLTRHSTLVSVGYAAHAGGFLTGLALALLFRR